MPIFLLKLAAGIGIPEPFRKAAVIGVGVLLLIITIFAAVKIHDHRVVAAHEAKQDAANAKADRKADTKAAEQRRVDDSRLTNETAEVNHAVEKAGNDPVARRNAYYACVRAQQSARAKHQQPPVC
jgi:hypothetical protein